MTNESDATAIAEVLEAEAGRGRAIAASDWDGLLSFLAPEYQYTHSTGRTENSADWIGGLKSRGRAIERGDLAVRIYGEIALVKGTSQYRYDEPFDGDSHYGALIDVLQAWVHRDGAWKMVASHAVKVPKG